MKRFRCGLVVGKFAPLHLGHELLVDTALARCAELTVLSYSRPELPGCGPARRRGWLTERFPGARVLVWGEDEPLARSSRLRLPANDEDATTHRRFVAAVCRRVLRLRVDAVFTSESYGPGFADELTRCYRSGEPGYPAIEHVLVDPARRRVPISGTAIRRDVHAHRRWLAPRVYASFVERVAILGGESSGKSSLAEALAARLATRFVPEYGRRLWSEKGGRLELADMLAIAERQVALEEVAAAESNRFLLCDTSPLTTLFYSRDLFATAEPRLEALARRAYHRTVLCAPDFDFVQDGTRRTPGFRRRQHAFYERELASRGVPYLLATGTLAQRIRAVAAALEAG